MILVPFICPNEMRAKAIDIESETVKGEYIVILELNESKFDNFKRKNNVKKVLDNFKNNQKGIEIIDCLDTLPVFLVKMTKKQSEIIVKLPIVKSVLENDSITYETYDANEVIKSSTGYNINYTYADKVKSNVMKNQGYTGKGVKVAIFDTGAEHAQHVSWAGFYTPYSADVSAYPDEWGKYTSHGSKVGGIIKGDEYGVSKNVQLYSVKMIGPNKNANKYAYAKSIDWAKTNGIDIVNMSYGIANESPSYMAEVNEMLKDAYYNYDILFIGAVGNDGMEKSNFPASSPYVMGVSNYNGYTGILYPTSTYGSNVEISAPGVNLYTPLPQRFENSDYQYNYDGYKNSYEVFTGTSAAAPVVSGVAALLMEKYPDASAPTIRSYLNRLASKIDYTQRDKFGSGLVQADKGASISKKITLRETTFIYDIPDVFTSTVGTLSPQTVSAIRHYDLGGDWYEIQTWKGYRWIQPTNFSIIDK